MRPTKVVTLSLANVRYMSGKAVLFYDSNVIQHALEVLVAFSGGMICNNTFKLTNVNG